MGALGAEKIKFQLIGMTAAILQGAPVATIDVDFWLNLPARQYMRAVNVARSPGRDDAQGHNRRAGRRDPREFHL